jgi:RNA polymerase sigma-70 factor (ECF subfamily)
MSRNEKLDEGDARPGGRFATTHWSVVLAAGRDSSPEARLALAELCKSYWYPLFVFVRRQGYGPQDAEDLTQAFFARLLDKKDLQGVDPERGKFRSFLLASIRHFLINEWDRARAQKRGGGERILSLDFRAAEHRLSLEPAHRQTPEAVFETQWAHTLLDRVWSQLREEAVRGGTLDRFERLHRHLTGTQSAETYAELAEQLGTSEAGIKMAIHRLRRQFHDRLRAEIAQTVHSEDEIDEELRSLIATLQS